ncbi:MAG: hypothetical protein EAZ57_04115, partial [Cytophagales bacterium]
MKLIYKISLLLSLLFGFTHLSQAATFYVNDVLTGDDVFCSAPGNDVTGTGAAASPFASIKKALEEPTLATGDIIQVDAGTYIEVFTISITIPTGVKLLGRQATAPIVDANSEVVPRGPESIIMGTFQINMNDPNTIFQGFKLEAVSPTSPGQPIITVSSGANDSGVLRCHFTGINVPVLNLMGALLPIANFSFRENWFQNDLSNPSPSLVFNNSSGVTRVANNRFEMFSGDCIKILSFQDQFYVDSCKILSAAGTDARGIVAAENPISAIGATLDISQNFIHTKSDAIYCKGNNFNDASQNVGIVQNELRSVDDFAFNWDASAPYVIPEFNFFVRFNKMITDVRTEDMHAGTAVLLGGGVGMDCLFNAGATSGDPLVISGSSVCLDACKSYAWLQSNMDLLPVIGFDYAPNAELLETYDPASMQLVYNKLAGAPETWTLYLDQTGLDTQELVVNPHSIILREKDPAAPDLSFRKLTAELGGSESVMLDGKFRLNFLDLNNGLVDNPSLSSELRIEEVSPTIPGKVTRSVGYLSNPITQTVGKVDYEYIADPGSSNPSYELPEAGMTGAVNQLNLNTGFFPASVLIPYPIAIKGSLLFNSGYLDAGNNDLVLESSCFVDSLGSLPRPESHLRISGTGRIIKRATQYFKMPLGDGTRICEVGFSNQNGGDLDFVVYRLEALRGTPLGGILNTSPTTVNAANAIWRVELLNPMSMSLVTPLFRFHWLRDSTLTLATPITAFPKPFVYRRQDTEWSPCDNSAFALGSAPALPYINHYFETDAYSAPVSGAGRSYIVVQNEILRVGTISPVSPLCGGSLLSIDYQGTSDMAPNTVEMYAVPVIPPFTPSMIGSGAVPLIGSGIISASAPITTGSYQVLARINLPEPIVSFLVPLPTVLPTPNIVNTNVGGGACTGGGTMSIQLAPGLAGAVVDVALGGGTPLTILGLTVPTDNILVLTGLLVGTTYTSITVSTVVPPICNAMLFGIFTIPAGTSLSLNSVSLSDLNGCGDDSFSAMEIVLSSG